VRPSLSDGLGLRGSGLSLPDLWHATPVTRIPGPRASDPRGPHRIAVCGYLISNLRLRSREPHRDGHGHTGRRVGRVTVIISMARHSDD
jgi:hypothetical protein